MTIKQKECINERKMLQFTHVLCMIHLYRIPLGDHYIFLKKILVHFK